MREIRTGDDCAWVGRMNRVGARLENDVDELLARPAPGPREVRLVPEPPGADGRLVALDRTRAEVGPVSHVSWNARIGESVSGPGGHLVLPSFKGPGRGGR